MRKVRLQKKCFLKFDTAAVLVAGPAKMKKHDAANFLKADPGLPILEAKAPPNATNLKCQQINLLPVVKIFPFGKNSYITFLGHKNLLKIKIINLVIFIYILSTAKNGSSDTQCCGAGPFLAGPGYFFHRLWLQLL